MFRTNPVPFRTSILTQGPANFAYQAFFCKRFCALSTGGTAHSSTYGPQNDVDLCRLRTVAS